MSPPSVKILVVDDSSAEREIARLALAAQGYEVLLAQDGQQALEVALRADPDLVLLDVVMPRLNGLEACRILKAKAKASGRFLPIVLVSTRNSANARIEGLRSGADDYVGKPYDTEELLMRVGGLLRNRALWSEDRGARSGEDEPSTGEGEGGLLMRLGEEFERARRYEDPLACVWVTPNSDAAASGIDLRVAVDRTLRHIDLVFALCEGREYVVLLPNTHFPGSLVVAERIVRSCRLEGASLAEVVAGIAFCPHSAVGEAQDLHDLARESAARARAEGGGRICLVQHQGYVYVPES
ncbi:MAG: response regulator [Nannocystaceae bacterium]